MRSSLPSDMKDRVSGSWLAVMPFVFVLIWSTGFIAAKYGLPYAPPLTFLLLRFGAVVALLLPVVLVMKAPWPRGRIAHVAVAGILMHAGYLGALWCAIKLGMPAGVAALIAGLQPVLTALCARLVGETVRGRQWAGLVFGLCGVGLVVADKISLIGLSSTSIALSVFALLSITAGTLYQKRYCPSFDLRTGAVIQFAASVLVVLPFALVFEDMQVRWTPQFIGALSWSVLALSIGAIFLLFTLIRKSAATQVTSLMYLTPPTTAVMAWLMFGEAFSAVGLLGMLAAVIGVALVVRK